MIQIMANILINDSYKAKPKFKLNSAYKYVQVLNQQIQQ